MGVFRRQIGQWILRARCADSLASQAGWLLDQVASFDGQGKGLADGVTVQVGWCVLRLRQAGNELSVTEPDFASNPFQEFRDDVTCSLTVMARQHRVVTRVGAVPVSVRFDDKVVLQRGCLAEPAVYAQRQAPKPGDSGWFVGSRAGPDTTLGVDDLEALHVYELLTERPSLLDVLMLPEGYLVLFDGDRIEAVVDPDDHDVWGQG